MTETTWRRTALVGFVLTLGLTGFGSAAELPCGPPPPEAVAKQLDLLEREANLALARRARGEVPSVEPLRADIEWLTREAKRLNRVEQRAVARTLQRLRPQLTKLGLQGVVPDARPGAASDRAAALDRASATGTGSISGTVRDAVTGEPIANATVRVNSGPCVMTVEVTADGSGSYTVSGLAAGRYSAWASDESHVPAMYSGLQCRGWCSWTDMQGGTPIDVGSGATLGVDFSLAPGGTIGGSIIDASTGAPVSDANVRAYDLAAGRFVPGVSSGADGVYTIESLPAGVYTVVASTDSGYADQVYGGTSCNDPSCDVQGGAPVTVSAGTLVSNVHLFLSAGGRITGAYAPVDLETFAYVEVYDSEGRLVGWTTNEDPDTGWYEVTGLASGTYYALLYSWDKYVGQIFGGPSCLYTESANLCDPTVGTPFSVTDGQTTSGVSFVRAVGGGISGTIVGDGWLEIYDALGNRVMYAMSSDSAYATPANLTTGTYYVQAFQGQQVPVAYNGCVSCGALSGTPVSVTEGFTTPSIDFSSFPGGSAVSGTSMGADGADLGAAVDIYDSSGHYVTYGYGYECTGSWSSWYRLGAGTYFAKGSAWSWWLSSHRSQLYEGQDCGLGCDVTTGTPFTVDGSSAVTNIDFSLVPWVRAGDTNADTRGDILWRHSSGALYVWLMDGTDLAGSTFLPPISTNWTVQGLADFNGDSKADILWRESASGATYVWFMDGGRAIGQDFTSSGADNSWTIQGTGDMDGDGRQDILWRNTAGALYVWLMQGATLKPESAFLPPISLQWEVERLGDFNGDGRADILWRDTNSGATYLWLMDGATAIGTGYTSASADNTWAVSGTGDMDGDGREDILWRHDGGAMYYWPMEGTTVGGEAAFLPVISTNWLIQGLRDFDGDGRADVLWREETSGNTYLWLMNGASATGVGYTAAQADNSWTVQPFP